MLLHIIRKELLDQLLSLRFAIACVVCLVIFLLSASVLVRDYREARSTYNMNLVLHRNEVLQRSEAWSLWQGVTVDRPLNSMGVLVRGLSSELTESVKLQPGGRLQFPEMYAQNPVVSLFPVVDFVFIVGIIMSLLALAFSYDAVSGERESGVLKIVMSYSVPRDQLLLGKWIGGYAALAIPFLASFLAGLVVLGLFVAGDMGLDQVLAVLLLLGVALLYIAGIYSLGIFVSCRTENASTSITVLLLVWVATILAVPNMAPYITSQLLPVPSRQSVDREKAEVQRQVSGKFQEMVKEEQERTGRENVWSDEDFRDRIEAAQEESRAQMQKIEDSYVAKVQEQTRWSGIVARLSPLTSFNLAALDLGAAGIEQEVGFVEALKNYTTTWEEYSQEKRAAFEKFQMEWQRRQEAGENADFEEYQRQMEQFQNMDFSDYPRFQFQYMSLADRLSLIYTDVLLLVLWNVLFFLLAFFSFLRYDVR